MKKSKLIAAGIIVVSAILIIVLLTMNSRPYLTVLQVAENPTEFQDQEIEVMGIVMDFAGGDFNLTEGEFKIVIQISGVTIPIDVENGIQVVVKGVIRLNLTLEANQILTQCS